MKWVAGRTWAGVAILCLVPCVASAQEPAKKGGLEGFALDHPTAEQLFRIQSENELRREIIETNLARGVKKVEFPDDFMAPPPAILAGPSAEPQCLMLPVSQVCFNTLYFQDVRTERRMISCGCLEPLRSAFLFYGKTLILPGLVIAVPPARLQCWDYPFRP